MCGCEEENVNHILIHCTVTRVLWDLVLGLFGVQWVFSETVKRFYLVGGAPLWGKKRINFGIPFRCLFFGRFGKKGID